MKKDNTTVQDELLPEYDLKKLRVRQVGPKRKFFAGKPIGQLKHNSVNRLKYKPLQALIHIRCSQDAKKQFQVTTFH